MEGTKETNSVKKNGARNQIPTFSKFSHIKACIKYAWTTTLKMAAETMRNLFAAVGLGTNISINWYLHAVMLLFT